MGERNKGEREGEREREREGEREGEMLKVSKTGVVSVAMGNGFNGFCSRGPAYKSSYGIFGFGEEVF